MVLENEMEMLGRFRSSFIKSKHWANEVENK